MWFLGLKRGYYNKKLSTMWVKVVKSGKIILTFMVENQNCVK